MKRFFLPITLLTLLISSCSSDDDTGSSEIEVPTNYTFERNGESTVSFDGQSTRIAMAEELINALNDNTQTTAPLAAMFAHEEGVNDFSDPDLNASSKSVRSKTAASKDYFSANTTLANEIKADFDSWISSQVADVFPFWTTDASAGVAGQIQEGQGGSVRYVTAKGLELNQAFAKSLIGGLMTDQALNNYLGTAVLDEADNIANNDNDIVAEGKTYTTMEHKWDEAYGYLYGASADKTNPNNTIGDDDSFLNKYIGRVEDDSDFAGIKDDIFNAFKKGRAAIVAKEYSIRDEQAQIIREKISQVIGIRAVYYLQQGKALLEQNVVDYAATFHDLSEGYGFIYSLQFTRKPGSNESYFTREEVTSLLDQLMVGTNGLWDVTPEILDTISNAIADKFDFTVIQAGS